MFTLSDTSNVLFLDTKIIKLESYLEIELHSQYSDIEKLNLNLNFAQGTDPIDTIIYCFTELYKLFSYLVIDDTFINILNIIEES